MELLSYIQSNIISMIVLFLMYFNKSPNSIKATDQKYFDRIILSTIATLFADTCMWLFNKQDFFGARTFNMIFSTICFMMTVVTGLLCVIYIEYKLADRRGTIFAHTVPFHVITAICVVLLVLNFFFGFVFSVDANNVYHREKFFIVFTLIPFAELIYTAIRAYFRSKRITNKYLKRECLFLSIFVIPPLVGGTIQTITGLSFTWSFVMISVLILYIKFQNQQIATDILTGLNNRRQFENYLTRKLDRVPENPHLYAVMIDIDDFKKINDTLGHTIGDEALTDAASILSESCEKADFLARYGGDEFIIICERCSYNDIYTNLIDRIQLNSEKFNMRTDKKYCISFSIGCSEYFGIGDTADDFIKRADREMYENKYFKRNNI